MPMIRLLMMLIVISCGNGRTIEFPAKERLEGEIIPIKKIHRMYFLHNTKDYLLLSGPDINEKNLHIYSMPDLEYLESHFAKGHAANEVLMPPSFCVSEQYAKNFTYVYGVKPFEINGLSITICKKGIL